MFLFENVIQGTDEKPDCSIINTTHILGGKLPLALILWVNIHKSETCIYPCQVIKNILKTNKVVSMLFKKKTWNNKLYTKISTFQQKVKQNKAIHYRKK